MTDTEIRAIPTRYAGCHFRSRLEARWAVFFDHLGIEWQYEEQGYVINTPTGPRPYLPDFWLPGDAIWVEVKGDMMSWDWQLIACAVIGHGGLPNTFPNWVRADADTGDSLGHPRLLLAGPIMRPPGRYGMNLHRVLSWWKGDIFSEDVYFTKEAVSYSGMGRLVGDDSTCKVSWDPHWSGWTTSAGSTDQVVIDAYVAARSARFEHGESGAT